MIFFETHSHCICENRCTIIGKKKPWANFYQSNDRYPGNLNRCVYDYFFLILSTGEFWCQVYLHAGNVRKYFRLTMNQYHIFIIIITTIPAGHDGSSWGKRLVTRWKSSWQALQKWVVPKQKNTATEQQYRHLYSRRSVPCLGHIWARATSLHPPHTSSEGS